MRIKVTLKDGGTVFVTVDSKRPIAEQIEAYFRKHKLKTADIQSWSQA